jgi:alkanesulfonate monooxygenase SsuD/methylene tetrahydromethanopterin reductase-like flavin-dependent oxidoreductase (luciferase family)
MKLGVVLPDEAAEADPRRIVEVARRAEALGFSGVWLPDHLLPPSDYGPVYGGVFEPLTLLSHIAAVTTRITLGTRTDEAINLIRQLHHTGAAGFRGRFYEAETGVFAPPNMPVSSSMPSWRMQPGVGHFPGSTIPRVHADTGGLSRLTASSSSVAATVAPSVRIVPACTPAPARRRTASPTSGLTPPRESYVDNNTRTSQLHFP